MNQTSTTAQDATAQNHTGDPVSREGGPIVPTDAAIVRVAELATAEGDPAMVLSIGARPGGCSGLSWEMFFVPAGDSDIADAIIHTYTEGAHTATVAVDPTTAVLAEGSTLEWKDGLTGAGFHIKNPNAQRTCGCGQSFS